MSKKATTDQKHISTVIGMKQVQKLLGQSLDNVRSLSAVAPFEQTNTLQGGQSGLEAITNQVALAIDKASAVSWRLAACMELQFMNGLRVSELLNIKGSDIMKNGTIKIKGLKGSNQRIITVGRFHRELIALSGKPIYIFQDYDRNFLYRQYKHFGISFQFAGRKKSSVTHAGRHIVAKLQKEQNIDAETTQGFIGHKSKKSTEIYRK